MTREELRDYVDEQRTLNNIPYHVYSALIDCIDTLEQEPIIEKDGTLIVTTDHYENVGRVLVQYGTNGTLFYQDREPTTKNDLGVDCISREDTLRIMRVNQLIHDGEWAMKWSMNEIKDLPSVTPQEPFINKPCVSEKQCEHDKNVVLDKIAKIIEPLRHLSIDEMSGIEWDVLRVIDKYKAESEGV